MTAPMYGPDIETVEDRTCGACAQVFPTAREVFSHTCPATAELRSAGLTRPSGAENTDPPERNGNGTGTNTPSEPTDKQRAFWTKLVREANLDPEVEGERLEDTGRWTRKGLSAEIDKLMGKRDAALKPSDVTPAPTVRRNRYASPCVLCGAQVAEQTGVLEQTAGRWTVRHEVCPERAPEPALADVPEGHYAIESTGDNDLAFYRVDRGERGTWVKLVVGGHPDRNVRREHVAGILARIAEAGIQASATLYGQQIGRCYRCNRHLTDETSRELGIGPDCRSRS